LADAANVAPFTTLTEEQWQAIRSPRDDWPDGTDWRGKIEQLGRQFSEVRAEREAWLKNLRGEKPTRAKERVDRALLLTRQLQKAWANSGLDDSDLPDPGLKMHEQRAEVWLYQYGTHVSPYAGPTDPMQSDLEWMLMSMWVEAGGTLSYSRKKDDSITPYGPLIDFLAHALEAIVGKRYQPSNVAKIIDRHRKDIAHARGMARRRGG
jgi:hypothetical protein